MPGHHRRRKPPRKQPAPSATKSSRSGNAPTKILPPIDDCASSSAGVPPIDDCASSSAGVPPEEPCSPMVRPSEGGKDGKDVRVTANYFDIIFYEPELYLYQILITSKNPSVKDKVTVISELLKKKGVFGTRELLSNGSDLIYTPNLLSWTVEHIRDFKATAVLIEEINVHPDHLTEKSMKRVMDILDLTQFCSSTDLLTKYSHSVRLTKNGLSLVVLDVTPFGHVDAMHYISQQLKVGMGSLVKMEEVRSKVARQLQGFVVMVYSLEGLPKKYTITGLTNEGVDKIAFYSKINQSEVTVYDHYRDVCGITLKHSSLPAFIAGTDSDPMYLPVEICYIVGGPVELLPPDKREIKITKIVQSMNVYGKKVLQQLGVQVSNKPTKLTARMLNAPSVKDKLESGAQVRFWGWINYSELSLADVTCFLEKLIQKCQSMEMVFHSEPILCSTFSTYTRIAKVSDDLAEFVRQSEEIIGKTQPNGKLDVTFIILPEGKKSAKSLYGKVKFVCETQLGMMTQCVQQETVNRSGAKLEQVLESICLKLNVKVGGSNQVLLDTPKAVELSPTIIFGADVTHPANITSTQDQSNPSIAAVVASMQWPSMSRFETEISAQKSGQEIIQDIGLMFRNLIWSFSKNNDGRFPERIIFFRDGVGDTQFSDVLNFEVNKIREAFKTIKENWAPKITVIIVQKRNRTRVFPADSRATDSSGNIPAGTVIDHGICHPARFDFFLKSHEGTQGITSKMNHYIVLLDENDFTADQIQQLSNGLCHM